MVKALKGDQMNRFKERYRGECEVLLMEEVQFFSGKEKLQAELCYTLDTLLDRRKKLVLTSCYLPGEISHLSQELRSRFTGGLITPIGPPDFPTRVSILASKAEERGVNVPPPVLEHVAEHVSGDVRRLQSALDCLAARSTLLGEPVSLRLAQEVLQDLKAVAPRLSVGQIQKIVCDYYQVNYGSCWARGGRKSWCGPANSAFTFPACTPKKPWWNWDAFFSGATPRWCTLSKPWNGTGNPSPVWRRRSSFWRKRWPRPRSGWMLEQASSRHTGAG
jgi:chromosomal replication initiator protein